MKLFSQEQKDSSLLIIDWDNDVLLTTDKYYTQGMKFDVYTPFLRYTPVNYILIKPKTYDNITYGLRLNQETYSPIDILSTEIQSNDYPYAGVLMLSSSILASNKEKGLLYKSELDLGVMGPYAGAGEVQYYFHYLINDFLPQGWDNQQCTWPVINYNFQLSKEIYANKYSELIAIGGFKVGTLHASAEAGIKFRAGAKDSYISSLGNRFVSESSQKWQYYFEIEPSVEFVAYNAILQGGWFSSSNDIYVVSNDISKIVLKNRLGLGVKYKSFGFDLNMYFMTNEFEKGGNHLYHNFRFYVPF